MLYRKIKLVETSKTLSPDVYKSSKTISYFGFKNNLQKLVNTKLEEIMLKSGGD